MFTIIVACLILAVFAPYIFRISDKNAGFFISLMPIFAFVYLSSFVGEVSSGIAITESIPWFPSFGVNLEFRLDGLSLLFAMIITGIGSAVFLYASQYMKDYRYKDRFYVYILVFMAAMIGVVTSDNIVLLFVFWELTSVSSFLLIGFNHDKEDSRYSALQALLVTGFGGLAMLAGFILLSQITGTYSISEMNSMNSEITSHINYSIAAGLILLGAFTKSAQFPFHFWLPNAMAAPTPVSAYLHSATMVKAGIFLMARMTPALGDNPVWNTTITIVGATTMILGAVLAFKQTDLKRLLAYTTLSVLGTLTMLLGMGSKMAIKAMVIYLVAHSLYKGALFLVAGIIDHETGTRDITKINGLRKYLPLTAVAGGLSALSMMGFAPFVGFLGKEVMYEAAIGNSFIPIALIIAAIIAGVLMTAVAILTGMKPFLGKELFPSQKPHEAPWQMWIGPVILSLLGLTFGLFPESTIKPFFQMAVGNILGFDYEFKLYLWHGFNLILGLSLLTIALGVLSYFVYLKYLPKLEKINGIKLLMPSFWYDVVFNGLLTTAKLQTQFLQNGYLRNYVSIIFLTTVIFGYIALFQSNSIFDLELDFTFSLYELIIVIIMIISTIFAIKSKSRLNSIVGIGMVGTGIAIIFIIFGAPDLALTQFAIEVLTVILFVLVIYRLPKYRTYSSLPSRMRDVVIAVSFGLMMTLSILFAVQGEISHNMRNYFSENAYLVAKGKNIVNVILVDFRAMDTMGEITVLAIAAIGVYSLIKLNLGEGAKD